jgi:probable rRNA maturation factor
MIDRRAPPRHIDVRVDCADWRQHLPRAAVLCRRAARAALAAGGAPRRALELALVLSDDKKVRLLNCRWRGQDKPTNVLAFSTGPAGPTVPGRAAAPMLLGDVVLAFGTIQREAKAGAVSLADHVAHLVVHGVLHLLGHDHAKPNLATAMERLETEILQGLNVPNPHGRRAPRARRYDEGGGAARPRRCAPPSTRASRGARDEGAA